jgi:glycogen debranching enzyme
MSRYTLLWALTAALLAAGNRPAVAERASVADYKYPVNRLGTGQSYGNQDCYVTLDGKTDIEGEQGSLRFGLRESTNQKYYLLAWDLSVGTTDGRRLAPTSTSFAPVSQSTAMADGGLTIDKRFFVPIEAGYLRSAHFLLSSNGRADHRLVIRTQLWFPEGVKVETADYKGHSFLTAKYPDGDEAIVFGSGTLRTLTADEKANKAVKVSAEFEWTATPSQRDYGVSFAYSLGGSGQQQMLLNALVDLQRPDASSADAHLQRIHKLLDDSNISLQRYLDAARFWTPNEVINRGFDWAKVNQLRVQNEYKWGAGFTNNPPGDVVVSRDSAWYLVGSSYYAQAWSRLVLDFWFNHGLELSGKFTEYLTASRDPTLGDDYGLNINDDTPLMMIAAHQYYSLTGDRGFLNSAYPSLLRSANYILTQRKVGQNNQHGLVWCNSTETSVRGLCTWRNVISGYNLAGAVTELNAECYQALLSTAELAKEMGDEPNRVRLEAEGKDLHQTIETYLRSSDPSNPFYYLNINPAGKPVADMTADLLFPALYGVSDASTGRAIMQELFSDRFWVASSDGAGGMRTISPAAPGYKPRATPEDYGLLGGVWPNLALWAARAAGAENLPDLALKGLLGTVLLSERQDPVQYNVVPGEFSEYFNGDDLVERGMPLSPFVPGIFIWSGLEGLFGITPHAAGLTVNPAFPAGWSWMAISKMPYRGNPLTILALPKDHVLYTTAKIESSWRQIQVSEAMQGKYRMVSETPVFWLVVPVTGGNQVFAGSATATTAKLVDADTGRVIRELSIPAKGLVREKL